MHSCVVLALTLCAAASAQAVVVPAANANTDAAGGGGVAGFSQRFKMQVLVAPSQLTAVAQRNITGLRLRRDGQNVAAMTGGLADLTLRLSTTSRAANDASPSFALNHGANLTEVFRARVLIPTAPQLAHRDGATWDTPHAVELPFAVPFFYDGRTLCVDLEGSPAAASASPWWRVDFDLALHDAQVTSSSAACDPRCIASVSRSTLVPGGSVDMLCTGPIGSAGVLLLSSALLTPGIDLGFLGAPGCVARVLPAISIGSAFTGTRPAHYGDIDVVLQLPFSNALLLAPLATQWLVIPSPVNGSLATTNALELRIASLPSTLPGVLVRSGPLLPQQAWPTVGRVFPHLMPVLRFAYQ